MITNFKYLSSIKITRIFVFLCLLSFMGCTSNNHKSSKSNDTTKNEKTKTINDLLEYPLQVKKVIDEAFDLHLHLDKADTDNYVLSANIELDEGSYIISPLSKDSFYLHFSVDINDNKHLTSDVKLLEFPNSVEELDTLINQPVRFVRENTTYKKNITVLSKDNFEVAGLIEFMIEPQCIPYDIEFVISNRSGVLKVEKTKTFISKEYKL